jgi:twinkle protein
MYKNNTETSKLVRSHLPCPNPACGSSDALAEYSDGHTFCFACATRGEKQASNLLSFFNKDKKNNKKDNMEEYSLQYLGWRKVLKETFKSYNVKTKVDKEGKPYSVVFPYGETAAKEREIEAKKFTSTGDMNEASLFGRDKFSAGESKYVTITEGELDALSAYQMLGSKYPVVSVRSSSSARRDCERNRDWLNQFERIYICFDNDEPGQKAVREVSQLFDVSKVYHVKLSKYKDANEYLQANEDKEFFNVWWSSRPYLPKGLIADYQTIEDVLRKESNQAAATYPYQILQDMTYGIRIGEVIVLLAQEKVGKTEVLRSIEHHILKTTDENIGVIHLEEEEKRSVQGLIGYELGVPCHLPDAGVSVEDQLKSYRDLTRRDGRVHFYSHFGSEDPSTILDVIRYLVTVCHCRFIFLDHITMMVTGFEGDDERKKLDYLSTRLAMMTRELEFTLFMVSHVNDDGKPRGSRNITKIADLIISLDRNIEADSYDERNKTRLTVRGNRFAGLSGPAGTLVFDPKSFKLSEMKIEHAETPDFKPGF